MNETEYEPKSEDLGNCPNCGEIIYREVAYRGSVRVSLPEYYWPCPHCGFTHYGPECPALE